MTRLSRLSSTRPIDPTMPRYESVVHMFDAAVQQTPDITAIIFEDRSITYRQFGHAVAGLAALLRRHEVAGHRVALMMANSIEIDVALMAVMAANAQVAPINPFFTEHELVRVLTTVAPKLIICDPALEEKARAVAGRLGVDEVIVLGAGGVELDPWLNDDSLVLDESTFPRADDLALMIFTGGSTGVPKGVNHTHRTLDWQCLQHCTVWPPAFEQERFLNVAPMFHIWGLTYATWVPIYARSTLVILPRYEPDRVVEALGRYRITIFSGGPAPIYMGLLSSPEFERADLSALKYCPSGGAPCPADLHREWLERTGCPLLEGWGMSEGAPFCINPLSAKRKVLSVGHPVPETTIEVVDLQEGTQVLPIGEAGEVRVRGPQLMIGYHGNPEETRVALRDGWMYTGDIGYVDEDGFLFLVDRKKDMVIVGGYNVYPREIDEVLFNHPKIREAATVGRPDPRLGEVLVAFVVLNRDATLSEEEFFAYCKSQMVKYKRPVEVRFVDALPKSGANKINRLALRDQLAEEANSKISA